MDEVCKMFGEEHPVSRERSLNRCVIVWWLDCLWLFREIMRNTVNFRQQKQKVTIGWQWMTMDRHSKTVQLCAPSQHLRQVLAKMIQSLSMQELPTFLIVGWHRTIFTMAQHFSSEKDCFDVSWALANNPNADLRRGGLSWITFVRVDPRSPKTLHHMQNYIFRFFDIFRMGRMTRSNEGLPNPGQSRRERCCLFYVLTKVRLPVVSIISLHDVHKHHNQIYAYPNYQSEAHLCISLLTLY